MTAIRKRVKPGQACYFTVAGSGDFPIDMLRYDRCWPASSDDAGNIAGGAYSEPRGQRTVTLACQPGDNWRSMPTHGRWSSFGWTTGGLRESEREI